jgi:hypothetical protein
MTKPVGGMAGQFEDFREKRSTGACGNTLKTRARRAVGAEGHLPLSKRWHWGKESATLKKPIGAEPNDTSHKNLVSGLLAIIFASQVGWECCPAYRIGGETTAPRPTRKLAETVWMDPTLSLCIGDGLRIEDRNEVVNEMVRVIPSLLNSYSIWT